MSIVAVIEMLDSATPRLVALAEAVSLAVRVEPELVRRARLALVPEADAGTEADLWFSALVDGYSTSAFMLVAEAAEALRGRLAADADRLARAWVVTKEVHVHAAPAILLEEEINYLTCAEGPDSEAVQRLLQRAVVALVDGGEDRSGVARWALRALARLPASVAGSEAGLMLTVAARSRLGHADVLPAGVSNDTDWLSWVLPRGAEHVRVGVRLVVDGLQVGPPGMPAGHVITLPSTDPLVAQVTPCDGTDDRTRMVRVDPARTATIRIEGAQGFTLETAWGTSYTLRPRAEPETIAVRAFAGAREAFVVWRPRQPIEGCLGFALHRRGSDGSIEVLPNAVGFSAPAPGEIQPSTRAPIQRCTWHDATVRPDAVVRYRVVAMLGSPDELVAGTGSDWSDPVAPGPAVAPGLSSTFNRGVLGFAGLQRRLDPGDAGSLPDMLRTPGSVAREYLGGDLRAGLMDFLSGVAASGGSLFVAMSELNDPEVLRHLAQLGPRASVILEDSKDQRNRATANALREAGVAVMLARRGGGVFHHRFAVERDAQKRPVRVWAGGARWTTTSLFLQANGATIFESPELAELFLERWMALAANPSKRPTPTTQPQTATVGSARVTVWFSPVAKQADLAYVAARLRAARRGLLFSLPYGRAPILDQIEAVSRADTMYIRGVTSESTRGVMVFNDASVTAVRAAALSRSRRPWANELPQFVELITRTLVLDPLGPDATVITGSHNLTPSGSARNDEALLVIEDAAFATTHALRVLALCEFYQRVADATSARKGDPPALRRDDSWQERFATPARQRELAFWLGAGA